MTVRYEREADIPLVSESVFNLFYLKIASFIIPSSVLIKNAIKTSALKLG